MEKSVRPDTVLVSTRLRCSSHLALGQISIRNTEITFSIWDLGGQREFVNMLPLVCNDAVAILFMFDLSRKSTLNSVKEWYRQARGFNKVSSCTALAELSYFHFPAFVNSVVAHNADSNSFSNRY